MVGCGGRARGNETTQSKSRDIERLSVRVALIVVRNGGGTPLAFPEAIANALSDAKSFPRSRYFIGASPRNGPQRSRFILAGGRTSQ
jgi:hypothetical protein